MFSCFCDPWEVPLNVFCFFKGWHSQNLGPHGTGANGQLSHFFCNHLQSNVFLCARVYCPFMLLPLFWFGQMMQWVFVWFNIPLLHSWISQDSFYIIRDTWNFWWGKPPSTTQFGVTPVGNQSPTEHVDGKRMEFFFRHLRGRFWWVTLRIWVCSAVLFLFFLTIRTSSATDGGSAH